MARAGSRSSAPRTPRNCRLRECGHPAVLHQLCNAHLRERYPADWARHNKIIGRPEARLFTPPLRPLNRKTSRGYEIIDFAEMIGEPLLPWQKWVVIHAMELLPDGSYRFRTVLVLVARQNGKSHLKRVVSLWRIYIDGARDILGTAQDVSRAREQWSMAQQTIAASPELTEEFDPDSKIGKLRNVNGDEWFRLASGGRYIISASNGKAARGGSYDEATIDELREQHDWKAWSAVSKTTSARIKGQLWAMSNQGDDESVVLHQLRGNAGADNPGKDGHVSGTDPSLGLFEYSGPDGCELDDWPAICQANPGLGHVLSPAAVMSALGTDPPAVYRTEVLCQRVDQLDGAIDFAAWKAGSDPGGSMKAARGRVAACFDIAPDGQHASLVAAARLDDGRVRVEVVAAWKSTEDAREELPALLARLRPAALAWYPVGPGAAFAPLMRKQKNSIELTGARVMEACQGLADLIVARRVVHPADPLLDAQMSGAQKLYSGDGWRFTRRGGVGHVDAAYAVAGGVLAVEQMPAQPASYIRVLSA